MNPKALNRPLVWAIAAALVVAAALGAWGYGAYRERSLRQAVVPQVRAADARLREALGAPLEPDAAQAEEAAARLDAAAQEIEARLAALRALDAAPDRARVVAAETTLDDAAGIVRKQATVIRTGLAFARSREALVEHMRGARSRSDAWVKEAIDLKAKMDKDYFNYKFSLDGLAALLEGFPDRQLASQVQARIDAALKHAADALAEARRLARPR